MTTPKIQPDSRATVPKTWTEEELQDARGQADEFADKLVAKLFTQPTNGAGGGAAAPTSRQSQARFGRLGYNHLLNLTDLLQGAPGLLLSKESRLRKELDQAPPEFVDYFRPQEAPAWVDKGKIEIANKMWHDNTIGMLFVLYVASLPACYLMWRGIPALYKTQKLADEKYLSQRLYETGLMLDAVLDYHGLEVMEDAGADEHELVMHALRELDPAGDYKLDGRAIKAGGGAGKGAVSHAAMRRRTAELRSQKRPRCFLWGTGLVTAKKVRLLHASMRYMLLEVKPDENAQALTAHSTLAERLAQRTWDKDDLGEPINQEDLAFTLLTFGYMIPLGMAELGCSFTPKERDAFLHVWRIVGHLMGLKPGLMTETWDEAERLYHKILEHQAGSSPAGEGRLLTRALLDFLGELLPQYLGLNRTLPPVVIREMIGAEQAAHIFDEKAMKDADSLIGRGAYFIARNLLWSYFWFRNNVVMRFPTSSDVLVQLTHRTAEDLIDSCRGAYERRPFYIPASDDTWMPQVGASGPFLKKLNHWRKKMFNLVMVTIACLLLGGLTGAVAIVLSLLSTEWRILTSLDKWLHPFHTEGMRDAATSAWVITLILMFLAFWIGDKVIPKLSRQRPPIDDEGINHGGSKPRDPAKPA